MTIRWEKQASQHARIYSEIFLRIGTEYLFSERLVLLVAGGKTVCGMGGHHGGMSETVETEGAVFYRGLSIYWKVGTVHSGTPPSTRDHLYIPHTRSLNVKTRVPIKSRVDGEGVPD